MANTNPTAVLSASGAFARLVESVPGSANFEYAWNGYEFYTLKGEFVAVRKVGYAHVPAV